MKMFNELFTYNRHCNQQLAAAFVAHSLVVDTKSVALFSHILNAHHIWNFRILGQRPEYKVWQAREPESFAAADQRHYEQTLDILDRIDLSGELTYATSNGQPFANTVGDILFHVINHSTYHRGQIALLFRQQGLEPLITDYIFYRR